MTSLFRSCLAIPVPFGVYRYQLLLSVYFMSPRKVNR